MKISNSLEAKAAIERLTRFGVSIKRRLVARDDVFARAPIPELPVFATPKSIN